MDKRRAILVAFAAVAVGTAGALAVKSIKDKGDAGGPSSGVSGSATYGGASHVTVADGNDTSADTSKDW